MGEVWAARDLELDRSVALKLLGPEADPTRFEREAHAAAALSHPNVTQLFDYGAWEGRPYMVLEFLPGGTLEDRLREGRPLPDAETERIAREIATGLAHSHDRRLVHRDLKPANLLFDAHGRAKIADFGIARMGGAGPLTEAGTLLRTAPHISPQQAAGGQGAGEASWPHASPGSPPRPRRDSPSRSSATARPPRTRRRRPRPPIAGRPAPRRRSRPRPPRARARPRPPPRRRSRPRPGPRP